MKKIYIIHGWDSNPQEGWFPWLKKELEQLGFEAIVPEMPETNDPEQATWISHLFQIIIDPGKETFLVGHDLGATTALRYLEKLPADIKIGGVALVAPLIENVGLNEANNFFEEKLDWGKIKSHTKNFTAIYSDDDPLVPLKQSKILEKKLDATVVTREEMKHFNTLELPTVLSSVLEMTKD